LWIGKLVIYSDLEKKEGKISTETENSR